MKMVNLVDKTGKVRWFNADHVSRIFHANNQAEADKLETWIVLSSEWAGKIVVYGNIPSVIREIEEQIEFPNRADTQGSDGPRYGSLEFKQYEV